MVATIFLTGATGYVGGEVLYQIYQLPENHHIKCLVRSKDKAKIVEQAFPMVTTVVGDLDDAALIESEVENADIVLHLASTRHEVSSRAIIKGLTSSNRSESQIPGYWLQIGGASMFADPKTTYGSAGGETYDDLASMDAIRAVIKAQPNRIIDNLIITQDPSEIRTALVPGPIIYGKGHGPVNTTTIQGPGIKDYTLKHGQSFTVNQGENVWSTIHVSDIGKLFALLVTAAASETSDHNNLWNSNGIYLPENGSISFKTYASLITKAAQSQNLIPPPTSPTPTPLSPAEVNEIMPHGAAVLGTNAKLKSSRAKKYLGWEASGISLEEEIPRMVGEQAERMKK